MSRRCVAWGRVSLPQLVEVDHSAADEHLMATVAGYGHGGGAISTVIGIMSFFQPPCFAHGNRAAGMDAARMPNQSQLPALGLAPDREVDEEEREQCDEGGEVEH